jgi:hypothetical protein
VADSVAIFEETKLKLSLKVSKGETPEKSVEFILLVDGEEHSKHTSNLQGTSFTWATVAPKIDDAKVKQWPYELKYQVKHGGDTHDAVECWTVWPKTLELEPKGHDSPVQLKLLQQGKPIKAPPKIAKDKTANVVLKRPEGFSIQAAFPWTVKNKDPIDSGQGRKLTVELERVLFQVEFDKLADGKYLAIRQMVNVKSEKSKAELGTDAKGHEVALHVKVSGLIEELSEEKLAESAGMPVYVKATFGNKTKRTDTRKLVADGVKTAGDEQTGTVKLDKKGTATFRLELPLSGGETCKVEIGSTDTYGDDERSFETWRQLHFQISHPASLTKPDPMLYVASYDEVKVEMIEEPVGAIAAGSGPAGSWIDGNEVEAGFGRQALVIGLHNEKVIHKLSFKNKNDARYAHFLICDFQFDAGAKSSHEFELPAAYLTGATLNIPLTDFENGDDLPAALPTSIKNGKPALTKLAWRIPSKKKKGEIAVANCTVDYANNQATCGQISCTLPADVIADHTAGENVFINFVIQLAVGPYNGSSTKNLLLIAAYNPTARPEDKMVQTMVHEVGHALGMVASEIKIPGIADTKAEHGRAYTGRGHSGGHCAKGVSAADYSGGGSLGGKPGTCVMFGEGGGSRLRSFCDLCQKLLLPAALNTYLLQKL